MAKLSMTDVAYNFMLENKGEIAFLQLWENVCRILDIPTEKQRKKKSQLYSDLMLDNRFASLDDNRWDLRNRRKFDELHTDKSEISLEDEEEEDSDTTDQDNSLDIDDQDSEKNKY